MKTNKTTFFRRVGNVYVMDAWIEKPENVKRKSNNDMQVDAVGGSGFRRPVAR